MKLLTRSTIMAVTLGVVVAAGSAPAAAIVGGRDATQVYPGMAALSVEYPGLGTAKCGAALITPRLLLTAAHCVSDQRVAPTPVAAPGGNVTARIGSNDRTTGGVVVTGKQVYLHPDWMWGAQAGAPVSDLALVELTGPVPARLMPVAFRQADTTPRRLIGWGLTAYPPPPGTTIPTLLQQRDTTRLPTTSCAGGFIGAGELCLGAGACFGDSGGPALQPTAGGHYNARRWASVGIASRETSEADPCNGPDVYTDITYHPFQIWIATMIVKPKLQPCTCPPVQTFGAPDATRMNLLRPYIVA
ncbi:trypsin-like serine protease [Dactylosporangium vinaceum]|uniref:Trypsin-like serine protease n=1 Tax=Dactylosporangium vinaceum TaxID=53362 RepID=A0ABV5M2P8_9ACTN|nr:trypsin-like serine protease [Dactylosporangium vinaceum]UAB96317.1 trypsin-like serine protease [Dactylosporangium vinaceum]